MILREAGGEKIQIIAMISLFSASNGVVLATEKKQKSILYDEQSVHKVEPITKHIGMVYSGMGPDYRWVLGFPLVNYCSFAIQSPPQINVTLKTRCDSSVAIHHLHNAVYSCLAQLKGCTAVTF